MSEAKNGPDLGLLSVVAAPARRALEREGITDPSTLARYSKEEILQLHGVGPSAIPKLKAVLARAGLDFRRTRP